MKCTHQLPSSTGKIIWFPFIDQYVKQFKGYVFNYFISIMCETHNCL